VAKEKYLLQDEQIDYLADPLTIELVKKQDVGRCLKGFATIAKIIGISMTALLNGTKDFSVPRVFELDSCKYLIPRI
jgi:hypothetical protein